jgi:hypothetical protein
VEKQTRLSRNGLTGGLRRVHVWVVDSEKGLFINVLLFFGGDGRNDLLDIKVEVLNIEHAGDEWVGAGKLEESANCHDLVLVFDVPPGDNLLGSRIEVLVHVLSEQKFELIVVHQVHADSFLRQNLKGVVRHLRAASANHCKRKDKANSNLTYILK